MTDLTTKFIQWLVKLQQGKPVQPPAAPPPLTMELSPYQVPVPYALEEHPRTFLHLLKVSDKVPANVRQMIADWLTDYDQRLVSYMHVTYGEGVDQVMDMITRAVMNEQHGRAEKEAKAKEDDVLSNLEKDLGNGEA